MEPIIIICPRFTRLMSVFIDVSAITIFPFIISKQPMNGKTLNHEKIHIHQQRELLILPFYFLYAFYFLFGMLKYRDTKMAYYRNPFEQEAYSNQGDPIYLKTRSPYNWLRFEV